MSARAQAATPTYTVAGHGLIMIAGVTYAPGDTVEVGADLEAVVATLIETGRLEPVAPASADAEGTDATAKAGKGTRSSGVAVAQHKDPRRKG